MQALKYIRNIHSNIDNDNGRPTLTSEQRKRIWFVSVAKQKLIPEFVLTAFCAALAPFLW